MTNDAGKCDLPTEALTSTHRTVDIAGQSFDSLLEPLHSAGPETGFLPIYYPKNNIGGKNLVDVDPEVKTHVLLSTSADFHALPIVNYIINQMVVIAVILVRLN